MHTESIYKQQGDGSDSWTVSEYEDETKLVLLDRYMVYEDPDKPKKKTDISNIDIDTITDADLTKLANNLREKLGL